MGTWMTALTVSHTQRQLDDEFHNELYASMTPFSSRSWSSLPALWDNSTSLRNASVMVKRCHSSTQTLSQLRLKRCHSFDSNVVTASTQTLSIQVVRKKSWTWMTCWAAIGLIPNVASILDTGLIYADPSFIPATPIGWRVSHELYASMTPFSRSSSSLPALWDNSSLRNASVMVHLLAYLMSRLTPSHCTHIESLTASIKGSRTHDAGRGARRTRHSIIRS